MSSPVVATQTLRPVTLSAVSLFCPAGIGPDGARGGAAGPVPGFQPVKWIPDRKGLKLMSRAVQLGVAAVRQAIALDGTLEELPPLRRALFVGASPQTGDPEDLRPALDKALGPEGFDLDKFAREGIDLIHPLWLVKGLSNNVLGFASAAHDLQGTNANWCDGEEGGWTAILEGWDAVAEGRADLAVAGGADALIGAEGLLGGVSCGEGAAFLVWRVAKPGERVDGRPHKDQLPPDPSDLGRLGAATWPVRYARAVLGDGLR
jgi:hypothetical protein